MMELRSRNVPRSPTPEKPSTSPKDLPESQNDPLADSSSSQDVDDGENEDLSRRSPSVEPQDYEEHSQNLDQSSSRRNSSYAESASTLQRDESLKKQPKSPAAVPESKAQNGNLLPLVIAAGVALCLLAVVINKFCKSPPVKLQHCDQFVTQLRPKYPTIDPMLWATLNVSVNRALYRKPGEPSTFIFLYDSSSVQKNLVEDVIAISSRCFDARPIRLTNADFETPEIAADYGAFLQQYKRPLEQQGVMVVQNLDRVPAKAARALFTICDSHGPLVERAVIFFTIDISQRRDVMDGAADQSPTEIAENLLRDQWRNGLNGDTLVPLLVRLTENVFKIM